MISSIAILTAMRRIASTTCLTVAPVAAAMGATVVAGQNGVPPGFGGSESSSYLLPYLTTTATGVPVANREWFTFQGVSGTFALQAYWPSGTVEDGSRFYAFNSQGNQLGSGSLEIANNQGIAGPHHFINGTSPTDGELVVEVFTNSLNFSSGGGSNAFQVDLMATVSAAVPEPSSAALTVLPVAGMLAWRRRRQAN